jgi:hypothetical protein
MGGQPKGKENEGKIKGKGKGKESKAEDRQGKAKYYSKVNMTTAVKIK